MDKERTYLNIIKARYDKSTANILNGEKAECVSSKKQDKEVNSWYLFFNIILEVLDSNQTKREFQIIKDRVKLKLFVDDKIIYIENPKDATRNY